MKWGRQDNQFASEHEYNVVFILAFMIYADTTKLIILCLMGSYFDS